MARPKVGRPTKYDPALCAVAAKLAKLGLKNDEMAQFFEVEASTFDLWMYKHPEFSGAVKAGKVVADANVASKLYDRACGAEWTEQQAIKIRIGQYEDKVEVVNVLRAAPPDTTACIFWLKNRQSKLWRDKAEEEVGDLNEAAQELQRIAATSRETAAE